jgi:hypothetical protein
MPGLRKVINAALRLLASDLVAPLRTLRPETERLYHQSALGKVDRPSRSG